jgi:hypothetical protein
MAEVIYKTKEECIKAIETLKAIGMDPLPWMTKQLNVFQKEEHAKAISIDSKTPIWSTLKNNYPYGVMPEEKIRCVEDTVDKLLMEGNHAEEPCLLLGKIQCGKTDTFEDIIGLAFDKGIDISIIVTKGTKALVNQTIMRMKHDYRFFKESDDLDQKATINIYDIMKVKSGLKPAQAASKVVIVSKKNAKNLEHLNNLFETKSPFLKKKKVLIVDDEADFASRNYRSVRLEAKVDDNGNPLIQDRETEMAKISQQIDDFRNVPNFCRYLQVTATPYCLYLQPQGELNLNGNIVKPFKPRFTSLVPIHDKYIGGREYFEKSKNPESMYSNLFHQVDEKCIDVLGHEDKRYLNNTVSSGNIYGLTYAIVSYFMGTAIRRIQERETKNKDYKASAVIHVEIDKKNHEWQQKVINRLVDAIKDAVVDEDQSDQRIWYAIDANYRDFEESNRKGKAENLINVELPQKEDVLDEMRDIFNPKKHNYHVQLVNSDEQMDSLLDEDTGELRLDTAANIFIGGNILDRGVTIKNMLCFFYGRNPKNFQQDTVLQHARMYGARPKEDMAVTRLHTTAYIHKILVRMNELDEQLREWFIEGKDHEEPNAIFVGFDNNIKPCSSQKIKVSNALTLKKQMRVLPVGFWTGTKTTIGKIVETIDKLIETSPDYENKDANGFFKIGYDTVFKILQMIESTYVYDSKFNNADRKSDIKELLCALQYCSDKANGEIYAIHRTNRNINRVRENGAFIDAPDDGRTDLRPSREKAIDSPVIMLIRENGAKSVDSATGENIGWNDAAFYWPVLLTQEHINPVMFSLDQSKKNKAAAVDESDLLEGINPDEVLKLTFKGNLEDYFGVEGTIHNGDCFETRSLKLTTASLYIERDNNKDWKINPNANFDKEHYHGLYSLNNGVFPFVCRPYKYLLMRNGRDAKSDVILMELDEPTKWITESNTNINEEGNLLDRDSDSILTNVWDTILDKNMAEHKFEDSTYCQWVILYSIKKVLKLRKNRVDWNSLFAESDKIE